MVFSADVCMDVLTALLPTRSGVSLKSVKERQEATRSDTKRQEAFKQFVMLKMSK